MKFTRTIFSDSPRHFEANVDAETLKNLVLPVVAIALANMVFPVPGGPNKSTPFHGLLIPYEMNYRGKYNEDFGH